MNKQYTLKHPELDVVAIADVVDFYKKNGRNHGLILRFSDQERSLTYDEIARLAEEGARMLPA